MARFYQGYEWAELVTDLDSVAVTGLSKLAASRTVTYTLNRPATAAGRVPSDDRRVNLPYSEPGLDAPGVSFNDRLYYMFRREGGTPPWVCRFAGRIHQIEDSAQADQPYSTFTAYDPWQYLYSLPVMNGTALIGEDGLPFDGQRGDVIALELVTATIGPFGPVQIDVVSGTFEATDVLEKFTIQQGTSVGAALQQLAATGTLDIVFSPVYDPVVRPGICVEMNVYVQAGAVQNDAMFSWDVGRGVERISNLLDGDQMANTVQFYTGPGGPPVAAATDATSEARYGHWEVQQFFPGIRTADAVAAASMAEFQLQLRKQGKRTVAISPSPLISPIPLLDYTLGDRVPVYATDRLRQPIPWATDETAYTRVYGIPITLSDDGVEKVDRLIASPDGFT